MTAASFAASFAASLLDFRIRNKPRLTCSPTQSLAPKLLLASLVVVPLHAWGTIAAASGAPSRRQRPRDAEELAERLGQRDWAILGTVDLLRLVTGEQLQRLHFAHISETSRSGVRRRCLQRLVIAGALDATPRSPGGAVAGVAGGSRKRIYNLGSLGMRALMLRLGSMREPNVVRRSHHDLSDRFRTHILAVSELYVRLVEASRDGDLQLDEFATEPSSWWRDGRGGWLKPDAYLTLTHGEYAHAWWIEIDLGTESLPTVRAKITTYTAFVRSGQLGAHGVIPRVLFTVPSERRCTALKDMLVPLSDPASLRVDVVHFDAAPAFLAAQVSVASSAAERVNPTANPHAPGRGVIGR